MVRLSVPLVFACTLLCSAAASAASPEITITGQSASFDPASCVSTWGPEAEVRVRGTLIRGGEARLFAAPGATCGAAQRLELTGSVVVLTPTEEISGYETVLVDLGSQQITGEGRALTVRPRAAR